MAYFFSLLKIPSSDYPRLYSIFIVLFPRIAFAIFLHVGFFFPTENFLQRESKYFSLYLLQGRHSYVIRNYQINHPPLNFSVTMTLIKLKMIYGAPRTQIYHLENNFGQYLVLTSGAIITKCHKLGGLKQQNCITPQFWRPGVHNQNVSSVGSFWL